MLSISERDSKTYFLTCSKIVSQQTNAKGYHLTSKRYHHQSKRKDLSEPTLSSYIVYHCHGRLSARSATLCYARQSKRVSPERSEGYMVITIVLQNIKCKSSLPHVKDRTYDLRIMRPSEKNVLIVRVLCRLLLQGQGFILIKCKIIIHDPLRARAMWHYYCIAEHKMQKFVPHVRIELTTSGL